MSVLVMQTLLPPVPLCIIPFRAPTAFLFRRVTLWLRMMLTPPWCALISFLRPLLLWLSSLLTTMLGAMVKTLTVFMIRCGVCNRPSPVRVVPSLCLLLEPRHSVPSSRSVLITLPFLMASPVWVRPIRTALTCLVPPDFLFTATIGLHLLAALASIPATKNVKINSNKVT